MTIPVVDLFAGPGGLGEGFSSHAGHGLQFYVVLSIGKDRAAHRTLELRAFFRSFAPDLHDQLVRRGIHIPGQKPAANLLAQMSHDPRFVRVERGTYALTEWTVANVVDPDHEPVLADEAEQPDN